MCGLCGVAGNIIHTDASAFRTLLFLAELRGEDATGVIRVPRPSEKQKKKGHPLTYAAMRQTVPASHFLRWDDEGKKYKALWEPKDNIVYMGHARSGTIGAKNDVSNAHPFTFSKIIGMHNGTINKKFKHTDEYNTDSEALYRNINDDGLEAALNEVESYTSAWALAYLDKENYTLNLIRNEKRPLFLAVCDNRSIMAWASEDWMLKETIKRFWPHDKPEIIQPKPNILFTYDLMKPKFWESPTTTEITIKKPVYTTVPSSHFKGHTGTTGNLDYFYGYEDNWDEDDKTLKITGAINPGSMIADLRKKSVVVEKGTKRFFFHTLGSDVPRATFAKILDRGCGVCSDVPNIDDPNIDYEIGWLHETNFICASCQENHWISDHMVWTKIKPVEAPSTPIVG